MVISLMMQFYREPRVSRIEGKDSKWPDYFEYFIEDSPNGGYVLNNTKYTYDENNRKYVGEEAPSSYQSNGLFDVKIMSGTSLPFQKTQRENLALKLYQMSAIDQEELLKTLEWKEADKVIQRMREEAQEQAQAQMQMQAQAQAQGGKA